MTTRRRFLRTTLFGAFVLGGAALVGKHLGRDHVSQELEKKLRVFSAKEYLVFAAAARRILASDEAGAPSPDTIDVALFADGYIARLDEAAQSDVKALLQLLEHAGGVGIASFTRFSRLLPERQDAVLKAWQASGIALYRQGLHALRTLAFLGYYSSDATWKIVGYSGPTLPPGFAR